MHVHRDNFNTYIEVSQMFKLNNFKSLMSRTVKSNKKKKRNILIQALNYIAYETDRWPFQLGIALFVFAEKVLSFGIPKSTAAYQINWNESNQSDEQYDVCSSPLFLQIGKQSGFARIAVEAKLCLVIAPLQAIHVCRIVNGAYPISRVHEGVATLCWWLAASWLQ